MTVYNDVAHHHTYSEENCTACYPGHDRSGGCIEAPPQKELHPFSLTALQANAVTSSIKAEAVNSPLHYGGDVPHEHWKCMVGSGLVNHAFLYNCTKYIWRLGKKAGADSLEDLKKARWYLNKAIEQLELESPPFTVLRLPHALNCNYKLDDHDTCTWLLMGAPHSFKRIIS